ncbi:MAG: hypothetical protein ACXACI_00860 [Candidatus Hodarchaeales archaeon]
MLDKLEAWPSQKNLIIAIVAAACSFLIFFLLMRIASEPIQADSSYDVYDLEFAWTSDKMETILDDWGDDLIEREIWATYLDFGFLVAYGTLLAGLSLLFGRAFQEEMLGSLGVRFVLVSYLASLFDALENINLLLVLHFPDSFPAFAPFLASICATIKFALVACAIVYILIATLVYGGRKLKEKPE